MLLTIQPYGEDEHHPDRLIFKFDRFTFQNRIEYVNQELRDQVRRRFGYSSDENKSETEKVFKAIHRGDQVLAVLPFAGGKSFSFKLPGSFRAGVTLVISPLGALLHEQDVAVKINYRFQTGAFIRPDVDADERKVLCTDIKLGRIRLAYITPESLNIRLFKEKLKSIFGRVRVHTAVIDAAHCISEWGHDFRPSYQRIPDFLEELKKDHPKMTMIALTSHTGSPVKRSIIHLLKLTDQNAPNAKEFYRCNLSYQVVPVSNSEEKMAAYQKALLNDIPTALRRNSFLEVFGNSDETGAAFCIYADSSDTADGAEFYLNQTQKILAEQKVFHSKEFSKLEYPKLHPAVRLYSYFMSSFKSERPPGPLIATREPEADIHTGNIRFVVHTSLADSIEQWYREAGRAGKNGERAHCVQIIDMPVSACEEDLLNRYSDIPQCSPDGCAFGRQTLCDYGKQHLAILKSAPDVVSHTLSCLHTLDHLISSLKFKEHPVTVETHPDREKQVELSLYRLSILGVVREYLLVSQKEKSVFEVSGFTGTIDENFALYSMLEYLKKNDLSTNRRYAGYTIERFLGETGDIQRQREKYGEKIQQQILRDSESGKLRYYKRYPSVFDRVTDYLLVMLSYFFENLLIMRYRMLWNLKEFIKTKTCRGAALLKNFQAIEDHWQCGACDICVPGLDFSVSTQHRLILRDQANELEKQFDEWLENDEVPFDMDAAKQFVNRFSDYAANNYIRARRILERSPRNIKSLYVARAFSPSHVKAKDSVELMRIASDDMPYPVITEFYETSPPIPSVRAALLDVIDDEYGCFNSYEGKKWLLSQSAKLPSDSTRAEMLGASLVLDAVRKLDVSVLLSKLNRLSKELERGAVIES